MNSLWKAKLWFATTLTALSISLTHYFRDALPFHSPLLFAIGSVIASVLVAPYTINLLTKSKTVRKLLLGNVHIEGWWLLKTKPHNNKDTHPITQNALCFVESNECGSSINVLTYRAKDLNGISSNTILATTRESDSRFMNHFASHVKNKKTEGITIGTYLCTEGKVPNHFVGNSILFVEGKWRDVTAYRIPEKQIQDYKRKHDGQWKEALLKDGDNLLKSYGQRIKAKKRLKQMYKNKGCFLNKTFRQK